MLDFTRKNGDSTKKRRDWTSFKAKKIGADATGEVDVQILVRFWWVVGYWWIVADEQLLVRG